MDLRRALRRVLLQQGEVALNNSLIFRQQFISDIFIINTTSQFYQDVRADPYERSLGNVEKSHLAQLQPLQESGSIRDIVQTN